MQPRPPIDAGSPDAPGPAAPPPDAVPAAAPVYDPASFWESRLRHHFDMIGVGYSRLGRPFNLALYRQRLVVIGRTIRRFRIKVPGADVVELGPGTGFFIDYWKKLGIHSLVGLDITSVVTERLAEKYPEYRFAEADVSEHWPVPDASADIVTAFDVLFHITDDARFNAAIHEAGRVTRPGGLLLVSDLFLHGEMFRGFHQVSRTLRDYQASLADAGFEILGRMPIFITMHPALDLPPGRLSRFANDWWTRMEQRLMDEPKRGYRLGRVLGWIDRSLTKVSWGGPSTELLVARRRSA
jgi:SAM-dependent methyltransferase